MNFEEKQINFYEHLIRKIADNATDKIIRKVVRELQKIKRDSGMMMSPEDCSLKNLWDEICVQIYDGESFYWDAYEDYIKGVIENIMGKHCTREEIEAIWFQTDEYIEWCTDAEFSGCSENELFDKNDFPKAFSYFDVEEYLYSELLSYAGHYKNAQIESYIDNY